jgi:hypothetical protein
MEGFVNNKKRCSGSRCRLKVQVKYGSLQENLFPIFLTSHLLSFLLFTSPIGGEQTELMFSEMRENESRRNPLYAPFRGNSKHQAPNPKLRVFFVCNLEHWDLEFVCNLEFVICNFPRRGSGAIKNNDEL